MYLGPKLLQPCGSVDGAPGGAEKRGQAGLALAVKTFMFVLPLLKPPPSAAVRRDDEVVVPSGPGCIAKQPLLFPGTRAGVVRPPAAHSAGGQPVLSRFGTRPGNWGGCERIG